MMKYEVYIKPQIHVIKIELENVILNSSDPTGTIPDMPWENSLKDNMWEEKELK